MTTEEQQALLNQLQALLVRLQQAGLEVRAKREWDNPPYALIGLPGAIWMDGMLRVREKEEEAE